MPKYIYYCKSCEGNFEIKHTLQETCSICEICDVTDQLTRRPGTIFLTKKQSNFAEVLEPGEVVKGAIEEAKQDFANDQEHLKNREYKK